MAKNEVRIPIIIDDKGSMKKTALGAHSVDRRLKGAARTSSGASKNFSKMAQGISGGLVPAYATLAASIFALDAVYRALSGAADLRILKEGQMAFAKSTGQAMNAVAGAVQRATQFQVSFKEASQAAAIAASAGFGTSQIVALGKAANDAAKVLGRSVPDAFDRLVRGVVKAEPEVLDELGIILRLDDAAEKYALQMGLTASELTVFEKQQAVLNDVLDQAEQKFAAVAESIDPNPWTQLGVAMEKVKDDFAIWASSVLEPIATFLAGNTYAAIAAMGIFIAGIMKSLIPSYAAQAAKFKATQELQRGQIDLTIAKMNELKLAKLGGTEALGIAEGGAMGLAQKADPRGRRTTLGKLQRGRVISAKQASKEIIRVRALETKKIDGLTRAQTKSYIRYLRTIETETKIGSKKIQGIWTRLVTFSQLKFQQLKFAWKATMMAMTRLATLAGRAMSLAMSAAGWIGMIYLAVEAIRAWQKSLEEVDEAAEKLKRRSEDLTTTYEDLIVTFTGMNEEMEDIRDGWTDSSQQVDFYSNSLKNIPADETIKLLKALKDETIPTELRDTLEETFKQLKLIVPSVEELNIAMSKDEIIEYVETFLRFSLAMQEINSYYKMATEAEVKYKKAQKARIDGLIKSNFKKEIRELVTLVRAYTGVVEKLENVEKLFNTEERKALDDYKSVLDNLLEIRVLEITAQKESLRIGYEQTKLYKFQKVEARRLTNQLEKQVKATQLAQKLKVATTAQEAFLDPEGKVKTGSEWELAEAKVQIARLEYEQAIHNARMEYLKLMEDAYNRMGEAFIESMAAGMQKGLEQFLLLKGDIGDLFVNMGQAVASGFAKEVSTTLTEQIMSIFPKTAAQTLQEKTETALAEKRQAMLTATTSLASITDDLVKNVQEDVKPAIDLLREALVLNTEALYFNTEGLGGRLSTDEFARINRIENPDVIQAGQDIRLPDGTIYTIKGKVPGHGGGPPGPGGMRRGMTAGTPMDTLFSILDDYYAGRIPGTESYSKKSASIKGGLTFPSVNRMSAPGTAMTVEAAAKQKRVNWAETANVKIVAIKKEVADILTYEKAQKMSFDAIDREFGEAAGIPFGPKAREVDAAYIEHMRELGFEVESLSERVRETSSGFVDFLMKLVPPSGGWFGLGAFGLASGGYVTKSGKVQHFAGGGKVKGTKDSVPAMLSPGETVLTPSQLKGISGGNTVVNVNIGEGGASITGQQSDSAGAAAFGKAIAGAVNREIGRQKRVGGLLY